MYNAETLKHASGGQIHRCGLRDQTTRILAGRHTVYAAWWTILSAWQTTRLPEVWRTTRLPEVWHKIVPNYGLVEFSLESDEKGDKVKPWVILEPVLVDDPTRVKGGPTTKTAIQLLGELGELVCVFEHRWH